MKIRRCQIGGMALWSFGVCALGAVFLALGSRAMARAAAGGHSAAEAEGRAAAGRGAPDRAGGKAAAKAGGENAFGGKIAARRGGAANKIKTIKLQEGIEIVEYIDIPAGSAAKSPRAAKPETRASENSSPAAPPKSAPKSAGSGEIRRAGRLENSPAARQAESAKASPAAGEPEERRQGAGGEAAAPASGALQAGPAKPLRLRAEGAGAPGNARKGAASRQMGQPAAGQSLSPEAGRQDAGQQARQESAAAGGGEAPEKSPGAAAEEPENTVSETLQPEKEPAGAEGGILIPDFKKAGASWKEDYSWFFERRQTKHKMGLVPSYYRTRVYGSNIGFRLFLYSPEQARPGRHGYYLGFSALSQIPSFESSKFELQYVESYKSGLEAEGSAFYSNYFEPYYGEGIRTKEADREDLSATRVTVNYKIQRRRHDNIFYGVFGQILFRTERPELNKDKKEKFPSEFLLNLKAILGYDSRDSWKDPKSGQFAKLSFGCAPRLGHGSSFCLGDLDARSWLTFYSWTLALRGFAGSSFFAKASYSLAYALGGPKVLRGFSENRFRGDKVYFGQAELRRPLWLGAEGSRWREFLSGAVFAEIGETAEYGEGLFQDFRWDYGLGLRLGIPPSFKIKLRADLGFSTVPEDQDRLHLTVGFLQAF